MSYPPRYALLLDGAFVIRKLFEKAKPRTFPTAAEIESLSASLGKHECVAGQTRLRTDFDHADLPRRCFVIRSAVPWFI